MEAGNAGMGVFAFGTFLFSFVPILILVALVVAVIFYIKRSREQARKLDDISRKLDELLKDKE